MGYLFKKISLLHFMLAMILIHGAISRPGNFEEFANGPHEDRCKLDDQKVIEVCQRCAKQTKSPIAYPMCCANDDDAYNWCHRFINYGKKAKRTVPY